MKQAIVEKSQAMLLTLAFNAGPAAIGLASSLLALLILSGPGGAQGPISEVEESRRRVTLPAQPAQGYVRYHFDEPVELQLDEDRIAVWAPAGVAPVLPAPFVWDGVESLAVPGWHLLRLSAPVTAGELPFLLEGLAAELGCDYVSPVFVDDLGGPLIPGRDVLVQFSADVPRVAAEAVLATSGVGQVVERDWGGLRGAYRLRSAATSGLAVLESANALARRPDVRFAEPDFLFTGRGAQSAPDDPDLAKSWGLATPGFRDYCLDADRDMGAFEAWEETQGDPSVRVLILDDGVDPLHPDLNLDPGEDFTGEGGGGAPVNACDNHGTRVAGCVAMIAGNGIGSAGIAPGCKVVSARVLISTVPCNGGWSTFSSWTVDALQWGVDQGIRITNNSNIYGFTSAAIEAKYDETRNAGAIHFAAAGNDGVSGITYPASLPTVHAVGSYTYWGYANGNYGAELDFVAPGNSIYTTDRTGAAGSPGNYNWANGTSLSSPYAAGIAALLRSNNPSLGPQAIGAILRASAFDLNAAGRDPYTGWGLLRAGHALRLSKARRLETSAVLVPGSDVTFLGSSPPPEVRRTCERPSFSADGRYAAFSSSSSSLVPGDTNGSRDVFVRDLVTQVVTRVSVDSSGEQAHASSRFPQMSANGRYVAFHSTASNLVSGDTNGVSDVFVHDLQTGQTTRVSVATGGEESDRGSFNPSLSADGRFVAFQSRTSTFDPAANGRSLAYVHDRILGTTTLVGRSTGGQAADRGCHFPEVSDDGQRVAFYSTATNLDPGSAGESRAYVYDLSTTTCLLVSLDTNGVPGPGDSFRTTLSGDGNRVAFWTEDALDPSDTNGQFDLYVRDIAAGTTLPASTDASGNFGPSDAYGRGLSQDGRYVVLLTASPLNAADTNGHIDAYRKDLQTGAVVRVSLRSDGSQARAGSTQTWISPDGGLVGFVCADDELTPEDELDSYSDVYLHTITTGQTVLATEGS